MASVDFAAVVRRRLAGAGRSKHRAALESGLPQDAIRSVLNGHSPRLKRVEDICAALGLELYIGPPRDEAEPEAQDDADGPFAPRPLTSFSSSVELPIRRWAHCSAEGVLTAAPDAEFGRAPAPEDLSDPQAFYAREPGHSMVPAGLEAGNYCLISPNARFEKGQRVWLRDWVGQETIKWLIELTATTYELRAWQPPDPDTGRQEMVADRWPREGVVDRGVVLAVYRTEPDAKRPPFRAADWRPDRVAARWRSELWAARPVTMKQSGNDALAGARARMASLNSHVLKVIAEVATGTLPKQNGSGVEPDSPG